MAAWQAPEYQTDTHLELSEIIKRLSQSQGLSYLQFGHSRKFYTGP